MTGVQTCALPISKWSGSAWACAADAVGGTGTVTNVATSNGILGGPITATGTLSADTTFLQRRVASTCAVGSAISAIAADGTVSCEVTGQPNAFVQGGNSFGAPSVIGTTDGQPLTVQSSAVIVNMLNSRGDGLRVEHRVGADFTNAPATINGHRLNSVAASASGGTIAGGGHSDGSTNAVNTVTGGHGSIGGGANNSADFYGTVSGGSGNSAGSTATVAGGAGNTASGPGSIVAGGQSNTASGFYSFAAGTKAVADRHGSFVWSDNYSFTLPFRPSVIWASPFGDNTFNVRAVGGVMFATSVNATTGAPATYCYMGNSGTGWICSSDRNVKEHVQPIQPSRVLAGVLAMPVSTWSIIGSKVRQMGPMAQDFYRAFGLGDTDKAINSVDFGGVAFAAIQGLNRKLTDEVKALHAKLSAKDHEAGQLKARLAAIEKKLGL